MHWGFFRIVDQSRYSEILDLLYTNFHTDEPMSKAVGMIKDPSDKNPTLDEFALDGLKQVFSTFSLLSYPYSNLFFSLLSSLLNVFCRKLIRRKNRGKSSQFSKIDKLFND